MRTASRAPTSWTTWITRIYENPPRPASCTATGRDGFGIRGDLRDPDRRDLRPAAVRYRPGQGRLARAKGLRGARVRDRGPAHEGWQDQRGYRSSARVDVARPR